MLDVMMPKGELEDDLNRLLGHVLPFGRNDANFRFGDPLYAFTLGYDGELRQLRQSRLRTRWRDETALDSRLDDIVARDEVRAVAVCNRAVLRRSDGVHETEEPVVRILIQHRLGLSGDFLIPLRWDWIRPANVGEPVWIDHVLRGRAYRRWPNADDVRCWPVGTWEPDPDVDLVNYAYDDYRTRGIYSQLHRAIEHMEDRLTTMPEDDERWADSVARLAAFLSERFRHTGHEEDLERALELSRAAVERGNRRPLHLARLAEVRGLRFIAHGRLADLDTALSEAREAFTGDVPEADDRVLIAGIATELLILAYRATADRDRLHDANAVFDSVRPDLQERAGPITVPLTGNASVVCLHLFQETHNREFLDLAVKFSSSAVDATPPQAPDYPRRLRDHGIALATSYELSGDESELERAYLALESAVDGTHESAPERPSMELAFLSVPSHRLSRSRLIALLDERGYARDDLDAVTAAGVPAESIVVARLRGNAEMLLHRLPQGSPLRPEVLSLLATLYREEFNVAKGVDPALVSALGGALRPVAGPERLQTAAHVAGLAAGEWGALFANTTVAQKLGASRSTAQLYAFAVDASMELAQIAETVDPADRQPGVRTTMDGIVEISPPISDAEAHGRAFLMAELSKAQLLTEQLRRGDLSAPPNVPRRLLRRERGLIDELTEIDTAAIAARGSGVSREMEGERRARLVAELEEIWASIARRGGPAAEYLSSRRGESPNLKAIGDVVAAEREETAVLSLYVLESRTVLFSASSAGDDYAVDEIPIGVKAWAESHRRFVREFPSAPGRDLVPITWDRPLRPLVEKLATRTAGHSRIVLAPHGLAGALSWTFLTRDLKTRSGGPPALSIVPSLTVLGHLQKRSPRRAKKTVVIGNPTGDLPHAENEAREVAAVLGVTPKIGPEADTATIAAATSDARILHLAAHAAFNPASPSDSYVLLSDGQWSARDALRCRMDAELVILSGCETGSLGPLAGDELMGMAYAFLHAGARAVVVTLWPVSDPVTAEFMSTFHRLHVGGTSASEALSRAAAEVRQTHDHPRYWAPFALIGHDG